jgi:hypothetical protein
VIDARKLGAFPVLYIDKSSTDAEPNEPNFADAGMSLLNRLFELVDILVDLDDLRKQAEKPAGESVALWNRVCNLPHDARQNKVLRHNVINIHRYLTNRNFRHNVINIHRYLTTRRESLTEYIGTIRTLFNLFYWTGNNRGRNRLKSTDDELRYWNEREWRIIGGLSIQTGRAARQLSIREQKELLELNPAYFGDQISIDGRPCQLAELCLLIEKIDGRPIREIIDDIRVPELPEIVEKAKKEVERRGLKARVRTVSQ